MTRQFIYCALLTLFIGSAVAWEDWMQETLDIENEKRAIHGSAPLTFNEELADRAKQWAEHFLSQSCTMGGNPHAPFDNPGLQYKGGILGENINRGGCTPFPKCIFSDIPEKASRSPNAWYAEEQKYPYGDYNGLPDTGSRHFSQMVWKDTREVGYGLATCNNQYWMLVARYYPMGNVVVMGSDINMFKDNVLPPQ